MVVKTTDNIYKFCSDDISLKELYNLVKLDNKEKESKTIKKQNDSKDSLDNDSENNENNSETEEKIINKRSGWLTAEEAGIPQENKFGLGGIIVVIVVIVFIFVIVKPSDKGKSCASDSLAKYIKPTLIIYGGEINCEHTGDTPLGDKYYQCTYIGPDAKGTIYTVIYDSKERKAQVSGELIGTSKITCD